ncbi:DUF402 domain-containing protein [Cohnella sp. CFH 77786]|uniref:DUF402 domain-containing protein n=1 Tax=Cohnella sp. CFH 77786 TaxID=2662265 RepID=UPI001C60A114|nr:DUF402 domain-containing protein [Cohnella sp. CFH 77786]MBW5447587.1 DUF402 domain-containing protein [Cohnella sp. CFH 77786]
MSTPVRVQALKYGNRPHYEWDTILLERSESHIFVLGEYGRKLHHHTKQRIFTVENWTLEFFPFDAWFTVSADVVGGQIQQYYCNINEPAKLEDNTVSFVDLDLDLIHRNGEWRVVDEDEFERNSVKFAYPDGLIHRAKLELANLQSRIQNKGFPFDGSLERFIDRIGVRQLANDEATGNEQNRLRK